LEGRTGYGVETMRAVLVVTDLMARSRLQQAATEAGYEVSALRRVPDPEAEAPDILVVDLDLPGALDATTVWRQAHPAVRVVGFAFHVEGDLIRRARDAGVEVVPHRATARAARIFT